MLVFNEIHTVLNVEVINGSMRNAQESLTFICNYILNVNAGLYSCTCMLVFFVFKVCEYYSSKIQGPIRFYLGLK